MTRRFLNSMMRLCWGLIFLSSSVFASEISPDGISGTLVICGGGEPPDVALQILASAVGKNGSIVVISQAAKTPEMAEANVKKWLESAGMEQVVVPELTDDGSVVVSSLLVTIRDANAV